MRTMKRRGLTRPLKIEFTAIIERDGKWFIAYVATCFDTSGATVAT